MTHDPYKVEKRKSLTSKGRMQLFVSRKGICCICGVQIKGAIDAWDVYQGEDFIDEHRAPLWLNGTNDLENRGVAHVKCARKKTSEEAAARAKGRAVAIKHFGAKKSKKPMPFGRASAWKRKLNGEIVRREK